MVGAATTAGPAPGGSDVEDPALRLSLIVGIVCAGLGLSWGLVAGSRVILFDGSSRWWAS